MANDTPITPELLRQLFDYDPLTGKFTFKPRGAEWFASPARAEVWNLKYAGKEALRTVNAIGYLQGQVNQKIMMAHRVAYMIAHGIVPHEIDHINGDRTDNRIANLRAVSRAENTRNKMLHASNVSGVSGVYQEKRRGRWVAQIGLKNRRIHLGTFMTMEEAIAARQKANSKLGYHANHGRK